tara:strand:+ start:213 stop:527 length:315 start_codon:yes stop_codon:yes gene_type:complete
MNKVLIQNGLVHEIFGTTAPELHEDLLVVDAPEDVEVGYSYEDGVFTAPPARDFEREAVEQSNSELRAYLAETDWYVIRFAETGVAVPADITTARSDARSAIVV